MTDGLNDRQRRALRILHEHDDTWKGRGVPAGWLGRTLMDSDPEPHRMASKRLGGGLSGLNTLKALERRGLVYEVWAGSGIGAQARWKLTPEGRAALEA